MTEFCVQKAKKEEAIKLDEIKQIVQHLIGDVICTMTPEKKDETDEAKSMAFKGDDSTMASGNAYNVMFLWALLTERWKLALVFWSFCPEPVAAALAAGVLIKSILRCMPRYALQWQLRETLKNQKR